MRLRVQFGIYLQESVLGRFQSLEDRGSQKVSKFELFEKHMRGNKFPNLMRKIVFYSLVINVKEFTESQIRSLNNPTVKFDQNNTD